MKNLKINKTIWLLIVILSLVSSLIGVFNQDIYIKMVSSEIMPGILSQDLLTIILSLIALFTIISVKENEARKHIMIMGIISYLFYGYGVYTIERIYTILYLVYLTIFGLSFYSLIFSTISIHNKILNSVKISKLMKNISIGFLVFVPLLFCPLWISKIIKLIETGQKLESYYSIYILDLCFIMPLFIIMAIMVFKNKGLGLFFAPALFIKGFTVLFPVGLSVFFMPLYQQSTDIAGASFYIGLALVFLLLAMIYLKNLKLPTDDCEMIHE